MALRSCCGIAPLLFRHKSTGFETMKSSDVSKNKNEVEDLKIDSSRGWAGSFILMMELRKKILIFRDIIDLPPCDGSASINELLLGTTRDLHKLFPEIIPSIRLSEMKGTSIEQALAYFCGALKSIADSWMTNHDCTTKSKCTAHGDMENSSLEQLVKVGLETLECLIKAATEKFDLMDEEDLKKEYCPHTDAFDRISGDLYSDKSSGCHSPVTPTSVLPEIPSKSTQFGEFANVAHTPSLLLPFRAQALGKLNPIDVKRLSFHMFPHVVAQDSRTMIQKNMTAEEPKPETEVKNHSEEMVTDIIAEAKNCKTTNETRMVQMSYLNEEKIGDAGNQVAALVQTPVIQAKEAAGDLLLPALALQMPPNAAPAQARLPPPPSLPKLSLNVVAPALAQAPLPPPSLPKLSINVVAPAMTPSPKLHEIITSAITSPAAPPSPKMSINATAPPPPPPPMMAIKGSVPSPPPPMPTTNGAGPPPPPPLGAARSLRPKKSTTKLKRSTHMGNLYRVLKGKVEGSCLTGKSTQGRKAQSGGSSGGCQGMADALAEMTKRSAYFQQIEEDVQKYAKTITELKAAITSFQTKDMSELLKFHKYVESQLEHLTDESQVLARFEGFHTKKLEALRMAAALYLKLDTILTNLVNWKIVAPLNQLLDKVEYYFNKIKGEVDALERIKDEEFKKFQTHNIHFDFHILVKIKESMVDVSSGCMELALKEGREAKATANEETMLKKGARAMGSAKMLWKAFQFAFRVYTFAGGQDDRADKLTRELAQEIETGQ